MFMLLRVSRVDVKKLEKQEAKLKVRGCRKVSRLSSDDSSLG